MKNSHFFNKFSASLSSSIFLSPLSSALYASLYISFNFVISNLGFFNILTFLICTCCNGKINLHYLMISSPKLSEIKLLIKAVKLHFEASLYIT